MKIKSKILLFSSVWLVIMLLLINGAIYFLFQKIIFDNEVSRVTEHTKTVVKEVNDAIAVNDNLDNLLRAYLPANGMIRVINEDTKSVFATSRKAYMRQLPTKFQSQQSMDIRRFDDIAYAVVSIPLIWTDGTIVMLEVTESLEESQNTLRTLLIVLSLASLFVLLPALFFGNMLSRLILTPIHALTSTMKHIQSTGDYQKIELTSSSKDELYTMGLTFNQMIDLLEKNYQKQQRFVSDASHELKTPLTVIESYASMLKRWGMRKPELLEESVDAIYSEAVRMKEMTEQMLELANADSRLALEKNELDLLEVCESAAKHMRVTFQRDIEIITNGSDFRLWADENKIMQVVYILLDNARKYSEDSITLTLNETAGTGSFSVQDRGFGIPQEDKDKIFDRFYRVDKARTRETGGAGLGLSIAKKIVEEHKGRISLDSTEGIGTTVTVTLPKQGERKAEKDER